MRRFVVAMSFALVAASATAASPQVSFVPWKVLNRGEERPRGTLVVFWIPATREEIRRSELVTSHALTVYASRCVGMQVVRPDDAELIAELDAEGQLPVVIVVDEHGREIGRVAAHRGVVSAAAVAELVGDAVGEREASADALLDSAKAKAASGDPEAAIVSYRKVAALRCLCPRQARAAQRALRRLGAR